MFLNQWATDFLKEGLHSKVIEVLIADRMYRVPASGTIIKIIPNPKFVDTHFDKNFGVLAIGSDIDPRSFHTDEEINTLVSELRRAAMTSVEITS